MENESLLYYLAAAVITIILFYYIIMAAVKSANKELLHAVQLQNRLLAKQLSKDGVPAQEILNIKDEYHDDNFWPKLKEIEKKTPEYLAEVQKIKDYQAKENNS